MAVVRAAKGGFMAVGRAAHKSGSPYSGAAVMVTPLDEPGCVTIVKRKRAHSLPSKWRRNGIPGSSVYANSWPGSADAAERAKVEDELATTAT